MAINVPVKVTTEKLSRYELLKWVNARLQYNFGKIEQLSTGAPYCHLMDMLFPDVIPLGRVVCRTNLERECFQNFKLLQAAFEKLKVNKDIPIERIIKGRYQDNLAFLQWFKRFYDANDKRNNQNATAEDRSSKAKPVDDEMENKTNVMSKETSKPDESVEPIVEEPKPVAENARNGGGDSVGAVAFYFAKLRGYLPKI